MMQLKVWVLRIVIVFGVCETISQPRPFGSRIMFAAAQRSDSIIASGVGDVIPWVFTMLSYARLPIAIPAFRMLESPMCCSIQVHTSL